MNCSWWHATGWPAASKINTRVLCVPWSMAAMQSPILASAAAVARRLLSCAAAAEALWRALPPPLDAWGLAAAAAAEVCGPGRAETVDQVLLVGPLQQLPLSLCSLQ